MPAKAGVAQGTVALEFAEDPVYGRSVRRIELDPHAPVMRVVSRIEKHPGTSARLSVWTIAQVREAERVFMPVPARTMHTNGYVLMGGGLPSEFKFSDGMISLKRDPSKARKIGGDGDSILWVGNDCMLLIECPREKGAMKEDYPDGGCSVEVYTNPDPARYIELETLGPLGDLPSSDPLTVTNTYTLFRRSAADAFEEAERILNRKR
jgi:hypothetical protein